MQKEKNHSQYDDPGRTPGSAEGEENPTAGDTSEEPGHTAGLAEGEEEVIDKNLGSSK